MSRLPRRATGARREVTLRTALALLSGSDYAFLTPRGQPVDFQPTPQAVLREGWEVIGAALTDLYSQTYPAHRPVGWWTFSAPQARRRMHGGVEPDTWNMSPYDDPDSNVALLECQCRYLRG